jgi:hypothetical protein
MKKLWQIVGWGLVIWSVSLFWPALSVVITPAVMMGGLVGVGGILLVYLLVQQFEQPLYQLHANSLKRVGGAPPTRPVRVIFPRKRAKRATRPVPVRLPPALHSGATLPMPVIPIRKPRSRPTSPGYN